MINNPGLVLKGINTKFAIGLSTNADHAFKPFAPVLDTKGAYEDFLFRGNSPYPKEFIGTAKAEDMKLYTYSVRLKPWEYTIRVDRYTEQNSEQLIGGYLSQEINSATSNWKDFPDLLVNDLIAANGTAFDGTAMFANSRNLSSTVDNLYAGTGTTLAQIEADLKGAFSAMDGFVDPNGIPYNRQNKKIVLIPSPLSWTFSTLRNSSQIYDGSGNKTNILFQTFDIVVNYWQATTDNDWYVINSASVVPAFMMIKNGAPTFDMVDVKTNRYIDYISTLQMNGGYGNPTAIIKVDNS
jgi:hypothetical protein